MKVHQEVLSILLCLFLLIGTSSTVSVNGINESSYTVLNQETPLINFRGISYELIYHDNPANNSPISESQINGDLELLQQLNINHVRTFGTKYNQDKIPQLAAEYGIACTTGAWVSWNATDSIQEINRAIDVANNSELLVIGSEARTRGEVSEKQLTEYITYTKNKTSVPVTSLEPWNVWIEDSSLAQSCDVLFVKIEPILEVSKVSQVAAYIQDKIDMVKVRYPTKEMIISVGWPSAGHELATPENQKIFYQNLFEFLDDHDITCYSFEVFDVPQREFYTSQGNMGPFWGVFDQHRNPKPAVEIFNTYFNGSVDIEVDQQTDVPSFMLISIMLLLPLSLILKHRRKK